MLNTDQAQVTLRTLFDQLDAMRTLLKMVEGNFKVQVGPVSASLSPSDVQNLKTQYIQLISQMKQTVGSLPDAIAYFP